MEFNFRAGVYRAGTPEGPPEFFAAVDITVEAEDQDAAEEIASGRLQEMVSDGFVVDEDLNPF